MINSPSDGVRRPLSNLTKVLLPAPFSPTRASFSPFLMVRLIPARAYFSVRGYRYLISLASISFISSNSVPVLFSEGKSIKSKNMAASFFLETKVPIEEKSCEVSLTRVLIRTMTAPSSPILILPMDSKTIASIFAETLVRPLIRLLIVFKSILLK